MARPDPTMVRAVTAARAFVLRSRDVEGADPGSLVAAVTERDRTWHDMLIALDEPCDCEEGTCPGFIGMG